VVAVASLVVCLQAQIAHVAFACYMASYWWPLTVHWAHKVGFAAGLCVLAEA
jgi:hypothetical protein